MMIPKVSVIVPVYNVEKYLGRCLDSLVMQTLESIEIIVINDGTKDDSQRIIDQYVQKYPDKVLSYIKENGGLGDARNYGLQFASAKYIGFLDSDDFVRQDMYEKLFNKAIIDKSDMVLCDIEYVWENSEKHKRLNGLKQYKNLDDKKMLFLSPLFAWNKLYHRDLLFNYGLVYPKRLWYEDIPVSVPLFAIAQKVSYVNEVLVFYVQRENSIMSSIDSKKMEDIFIVLNQVFEFYKNHNLFDEYREEIEYIYIEQLMLYGSFRFYRSPSSFVLVSKALKTMERHFPNWKKNRYIKTLSVHYQYYLKTTSYFTMPLFKMILMIKDLRC